MAQLARTKRLMWLCMALGNWKLFATALSLGNRSPSILPPAVNNGAARARLKRAGAHEAAFVELRAECTALRAKTDACERQLALVQKQLAAAVDRRRVVESDGKHAHELLSRMHVEQGRARAARDGLATAQEAEAEWRREASRAVRERQMLARELEHEERTAKWARELVLSCHNALLEAQHAQRRHVTELNDERRRGLMRAAGLQAGLKRSMHVLVA